MLLKKADVMKMIKEMPEKLDAEELMYRIYLWEKIQAGESDIRAGRVKSHDQVMKEAAKWLKYSGRTRRQTISKKYCRIFASIRGGMP